MPGVAERLEAKHRGGTLVSRKIEYGEDSDPVEICYERGWTDGLPVTPPTDARVLANDLRVLGKGASDLFASKMPADQDRLARLLFASAQNGGSLGLDYNSFREELPKVRAALLPRVQSDESAFLQQIAPTLQRALAMQGPVVVGIPGDYRDNHQLMEMVHPHVLN